MTANNRMTENEKKNIVKDFSRHINKGQVNYLKAGHLDMLETERHSVYFTDSVSGKKMIDCFASVGCFNIGRRNPVIIEAIKEAAGFLDMGTYCLLSDPKIKLAQKLVSLMPGDLNKVIFTAGGGDGIDCSLKLARGATGRKEIISTIKAYHGHVGFALSANGKEHYRKHFEPLMPGFKLIPYNDLEAAVKVASKNTAAIIVEPVQGEGGIYVGKTEYLQGLRKLCDELGIILIFDEVQTGFGRTGKLFAFEHSGVAPDILILAKSMSGGLFPNAALIHRDIKIIMDFLKKNPEFHYSYSGGSDLGCYTSLRVLDYIIENDLPANAEKMGKRLRDAIEEIRTENPKIVKEVRGIGMMVGLEYIHEFLGAMMSEALAKNGVFAAYSGNAPQVMRFMMPIVATEEEVDLVIEAIKNSVKSMKTLLPVTLIAAKVPFFLKLLNNEKVQIVVFNWVRFFEDNLKKISNFRKKRPNNE